MMQLINKNTRPGPSSEIKCQMFGKPMSCVCVCVCQNTDGGSALRQQDAHVAPPNHRIKTANPAPVF